MSKNPIFQERKKMSKNPSKKKFFTAKFIVKKIRKIFTAKFIEKKNLKKNFSSKKWLKIFEKKVPLKCALGKISSPEILSILKTGRSVTLKY